MKNSNEWMNDIRNKAEQRLAAQRRRKKIIISTASSAACLMLVMYTVIAVPNILDNGGQSEITGDSSGEMHGTDAWQNNSGNENSEHVKNPEDIPSENPSVTPPTDEPIISLPIDVTRPNGSVNHPCEGDFYINYITKKISPARKYRNPKEHYEEIWTKDQVTDYLGIDLTTLATVLPDDLTYNERDNFRMLFHNSGEIVEDFQTFVYRGKGEQRVEISVSKITTPYDFLYQLDREKTSLVNGVEVLAGVEVRDTDPLFSNGPIAGAEPDLCTFCYADFQSNGLWYRIECHNMPLGRLSMIVEEIIKEK